MAHKFRIVRDWYDTGEKIYNKASVEIKDGLTVLCGCNGCGKTTLLRQIETVLKKENVPVLSFDNFHDGGSNATALKGFICDVDFVIESTRSSEGENINMNIGDFARKMGTFMRNHHGEKEVFFLIDAVDSGLSIDNVIDLKRDLFDFVISDCKGNGVTVYFIVSANEYELARGEQCLDTLNLKYITFDSYEDYRQYIIKTRKAKNKRYKWEEWEV